MPASEPVTILRDGGDFIVRFHGIADFWMSADGVQLRCNPLPNSKADWESIYRQQMIPLQLAQQGKLVYHGGAVCSQNQAVVLLGPSGQGKSTLTAACAAQGMAFLTDDCLLLSEGTSTRVLPHEAYVRLWADSFEALNGKEPEAAAHHRQKAHLQADPQSFPHRPTSAQMACMIALDGQSDDIVLQRVSPADAAMYWRANAFVLDLRSPEVLRRSMQRAAQLAEAVPAYRLTYPRDYARLPEVVAVVSDCLSAASSNAA